MTDFNKCHICDSTQNHLQDCGLKARRMLIQLRALAYSAHLKGENLQGIPELKLVGNAYVGMSQRMMSIIDPELVLEERRSE